MYRRFSSFPQCQNCLMAHPISCAMDTEGTYPREKQLGRKIKNPWSSISTSLPKLTFLNPINASSFRSINGTVLQEPRSRTCKAIFLKNTQRKESGCYYETKVIVPHRQRSETHHRGSQYVESYLLYVRSTIIVYSL